MGAFWFLALLVDISFLQSPVSIPYTIHSQELIEPVVAQSHNKSSSSPSVTTPNKTLVAKPFVVGGAPVGQHKYPFLVSLQYGVTHFCGGSIISETMVATAGHCLVHIPDPENIVVVAGKHDLTKDEGTAQRRGIVNAVYHHRFDPNYFTAFDLVVLEVAEPFVFTDEVKKIELYPTFDEEGEATIIGWGLTDENDNSIPEIPHSAEITIFSSQDCESLYNNCADCPQYLPEAMLCGGNPDLAAGGKDACTYDSGGPLVTKRGDTSYLVGIVSWGKGCARPHLPGVYSRVSALLGGQ